MFIVQSFNFGFQLIIINSVLGDIETYRQLIGFKPEINICFLSLLILVSRSGMVLQAHCKAVITSRPSNLA